jgi:hypothetical protein
MSKKPTRKPYQPASDPPPRDPDDEPLEEEEVMPDDPKTPEGEPVHPDPEGKMRSHAPGYTTGPEGESVELPKEEEKDK